MLQIELFTFFHRSKSDTVRIPHLVSHNPLICQRTDMVVTPFSMTVEITLYVIYKRIRSEIGIGFIIGDSFQKTVISLVGT